MAPIKGSIVINPLTSRPVKVGSRVWRKLVNDGILENSYENQQGEYELQGDEDIEQAKEDANDYFPLNQTAVRGRGQYKGKLVGRTKRATPEELVGYTSACATRAIKQNKFDAEQLSNEELSSMLEMLISQEMIGSGPAKSKRSKPIDIPRGYEIQPDLDDTTATTEPEDDDDYPEMSEPFEDDQAEYEEVEYTDEEDPSHDVQQLGYE